MEIGGGFGGKINVYEDPVAALLSKKVGHKPVKMVMSRAEVFEGTGPTPGSHMTVKIGATIEDTKLLPKTAYKGLLTDNIINKKKTGWTAPALFWRKQNMDKDLMRKVYDDMFANANHNIQGLQQGAKSMIPGMITNLWATKYNMHI